MKKIFLSVFLIVFGITVGLLLTEILLRSLNISYLSPITMDETRVLRMIPGLEGRYRDEGDAHVRINSLGYRDFERPAAKPNDVYRIAVLGDSFTAGLSVDFNDIFTSVMERELNDCLRKKSFAKKVEIMNFGVPGYSPTQEFITFQRDALKFSPDAVLLAVYTGNDIEFITPDAAAPFHPFYTVQDGKTVLDESFKKNPIYQIWLAKRARWPGYETLQTLKNHSRVWQVFDRVRRGLYHPVSWQEFDSDNVTALLNVDSQLYQNAVLNVQVEAWENFAAVLERFRETTQSHDIKFWVTTLSNEIQVFPEPQIREKFARDLNVADLFYPERKMQDIGAVKNIPVISLATTLAEMATRKKIFFHGFANTRLGFGHWNPEGHRWAGKILSEYVCDQLGQFNDGVKNFDATKFQE